MHVFVQRLMSPTIFIIPVTFYQVTNGAETQAYQGLFSTARSMIHAVEEALNSGTAGGCAVFSDPCSPFAVAMASIPGSGRDLTCAIVTIINFHGELVESYTNAGLVI